jgi:hypothetical protein
MFRGPELSQRAFAAKRQSDSDRMKFDGHTFYFIQISWRGAMTSVKSFALAALQATPIPIRTAT